MVMILYAFLTDLRPSVVRASIVLIIVLSAHSLGRKANGINSLAIACLLILCFSPSSLYDIGFQLSFTATSGILFLFPSFNSITKSPTFRGSFFYKYALVPSFITISAMLGTLPVMLVHFNRVSAIAPLANVFVVPLIGLSLCLGILTVFTGFISSALSGLPAELNNIILKLIMFIVSLFAKPAFASLILPAQNAFGISLYYFSLILFFLKTTGKKTRIFAIFVFVLSISLPFYLTYSNLRI
jgi:competence protein ComEC